jgi:hypothetical protein
VDGGGRPNALQWDYYWTDPCSDEAVVGTMANEIKKREHGGACGWRLLISSFLWSITLSVLQEKPSCRRSSSLDAFWSFVRAL